MCLECAREHARLHIGSALDPSRLLSGARIGRDGGGFPAYACRQCGATLADIVADGRPGCCACYTRFAEEVERAILAAQGRTRHTGKTPEG